MASVEPTAMFKGRGWQPPGMTTTVSKPTGYAPNRTMSVLGYLVAIGIALVLLPLAPFIALVWLYFKFTAEESQPAEE